MCAVKCTVVASLGNVILMLAILFFMRVQVSSAGFASPPSSMCRLDEELLFMGSWAGDSLLVRSVPEVHSFFLGKIRQSQVVSLINQMPRSTGLSGTFLLLRRSQEKKAKVSIAAVSH